MTYIVFLCWVPFFTFSYSISNVAPFPVFSTENPYPIFPAPASVREFYLPPTHFCFFVLEFAFTGVSNLLRTKGLSSHLWPKRPTSATYAYFKRENVYGLLWFYKWNLLYLAYLAIVSNCTLYGLAYFTKYSILSRL